MSIERIRVDVPGSPYDVLVGPGLLADAGARVREVTPAGRAALVCDENVAGRYGVAVDVSLARAGMDVLSLTIPPGETSKRWGLAGELIDELVNGAISRTDVVVALGGGVIGDLAGFAAAVYLRGVDFVQVPTTLLAMVDSSVGGKTGVDLKGGKNLAGAFKQPLVVIADTDTLATLPEAEWRSGLAEVAKSAVLDGEEFLSLLETHAAELLAREPEIVTEVVRRCVEFKARVVARDEKEEGPRECLNYGHTLGHALEKTLGYGTLTHGAAVAEGMRFAARVAVQAGHATAEFVKRQDRLLDALGLTAIDTGAVPAMVLEAMRTDKKSRERIIRMVLPDGPGVWRCEPVSDTIVIEHLTAWASTKDGE